MNFTNELLKMMRSGANVDDIAADLTANLNTAKNTYEREQNDVKSRDQRLNKYASNIIKNIAAYIGESCPDAEDIVNVLDTSATVKYLRRELDTMLASMDKGIEISPKIMADLNKTSKKDTIDDIFAKFFEENDL